MDIISKLLDLTLRGWQFWVKENRLCYRAPQIQADSISSVLAELKPHKEEIIKLLTDRPELFDIFPLSYNQKSLWFLWQIEPDSWAYNVSFSGRLLNANNVQNWRKTFEKLIERHSGLRTCFPSFKGQPYQRVQKSIELDFQEIDSSSWNEDKLHRELIKSHQEPFNLEKGPIFRVKCFLQSSEELILLFSLHHIVCDGWSFNLMLEELPILYQEETTLQTSALKAQDYSYKDFVNWQQNLLENHQGEHLAKYWREKLEGQLPVLELPTNRFSVDVRKTYNGGSHAFRLTPELTGFLRNLAKVNQVSLYTLLLSVYQILLYRYSGQEEIIIGSPVVGRSSSEFLEIVGHFVNMLPIRSDIVGKTSFTEHLLQTQKTVLEALDNQDFPFAKMVEQLQLQRDTNHPPIFQTTFVLQRFQHAQLQFTDESENIENTEPQDWKGLTVVPYGLKLFEGQYDLSLEMIELDSSLVGTFKYNSDLFDSSTVKRILNHFQILLEGIVANPNKSITTLPLLTEAEQHQLLIEWNDTQRDYPKDKCIHQLFEEQVERSPDAVAVTYKNQRLTYRQLNQRANQLAHYLQSLKVAPGVLVGICLEPSLELITSLIGILKAGGVYVPLDPHYPQERLAFMLEDSQVQILVTQEHLSKNISSQYAPIVCLDRDKDLISREDTDNLTPQTSIDDLAYAIYTSGSTGKPKAVLGKLRGIINRLRWMWDMLPFTANEVCCQKTSINFVDHVAEIFSPLLQGISLAIAPEEARSDILQLTKLINEEKITRIVLVPSLLKAILEQEAQQLTQLHSLKYVFCSGEALTLNLAKKFHQKLGSTKLLNLYGSSEIAADVTCFEVNRWETRGRIMQYFKPKVVHDAIEDRLLESDRQPFTQPGISPEMLATKFQRSELPFCPLTVEDYYDKLSHDVLPYTINTGAPQFIGHMTSALPDFMHDMSKLISRLNQNLVKIETSKSLIFLEREAIAILHRLVYNFSDKFYQENIQQKNRNLGIVTTGGTTANISALLCARNQGLFGKEDSLELSTASIYQILQEKGYRDIVIIGSRLMHYSVNKAASMLGLGTNNIVFIDGNDNRKLNLNLLEEKILECRENKLYILALVGIAGTTETGEVDPLPEMGNIARKFGIHFHIDAAWGGATMFSEKHKGKLKGIEKADSITICGHKQLYLPQGISVCLFKNPQMLNFAQTTARYQAQQDTFDVGRFTIEGSRSALSLCLHGALHIIGKKGYEILIDDGIEKARYFAQLIELLEPFELIMEPVLNIVNYRYIPEDLRIKARHKLLVDDDTKRINQINIQIQQVQFERGITFVSKTTLVNAGNYKNQEIVVFRAVLSNPNTTATDLHDVLEDQLKIASQIESKEHFDRSKHLVEETITVEKIKTAVKPEETIHLQPAANLQVDSEKTVENCLNQNTIPIGKPISNTQIYILDGCKNLLPIGITGELYVGGDGVSSGYLNQPELTKEKFIQNPFQNNLEKNRATVLFKTGDLARWLPDGNIEFVGRVDHQVKIRGFRIELGEIETVLTQHSEVREAVVIAKDEGFDDKRLVCYVVPEQEQLSASKLRSFLQERLPHYMLPSAFVFLDTIPLTPNGKVDRKALPIPSISAKTDGSFAPPTEEIELKLTEIWSEILGIHPVGIKDNFFELGGHSLLAASLFAQIKNNLHISLPLSILFTAPTIEQLASVIRQSDWTAPWHSLVPIQTEGERPPLFCVHGGGFNVLIYRELALNLGKNQPVYGLQAKGMDGKSTPHSTIEDMAADYVKYIREIQPEGPYFLAGLSNGGRIALEIAQQLHKQSQEIALLAMFDTIRDLDSVQLLPPLPRLLSTIKYSLLYSMPRFASKSRQIKPLKVVFELRNNLENKRILLQPKISQFERQATVINKNTVSNAPKQINYVESIVDSFHSFILSHSPVDYFYNKNNFYTKNLDVLGQEAKQIDRIHKQARARYVPQVYAGRITLFKANEQAPGFAIDSQYGWGEIAKGGLEIYKIPGHHTSILQSPKLAEKLSECIAKAL